MENVLLFLFCTCHEGGAIVLLELGKATAIDQAGNDIFAIERLLQIITDNTANLVGGVQRLLRCAQRNLNTPDAFNQTCPNIHPYLSCVL